MLTFTPGEGGQLKVTLSVPAVKRLEKAEEVLMLLSKAHGPWQEHATDGLAALKALDGLVETRPAKNRGGAVEPGEE